MFVFFFKQKTAYEMRISDWSSDVCSSDLMLASYEAGLKQGDRLAAIRAGHAFHTIFIEASGNSELLRVTLDRRSLIARFILLRGNSSLSRSGLRKHEAILQALREGDTQLVLDSSEERRGGNEGESTCNS